MTAATREIVGKRIRNLRKENGLSQQTLALMAGVERSYLAKLEKGLRNPSIDCYERIAGGLGITLSDLFAGAELEGRAIQAQRTELERCSKSKPTTAYQATRL